MSLGHIGDNIPDEWLKPLLVELVNPKQWKTISTKELLDDGYVVYGANGKIGFYNEFTHENPTLMITCRGATCGNLHISEPYSYINGNAMALDDQPTNLIGLNFLCHVLQARGLEDTISGSAQPQITRQGLMDVRIPLPPLAEQKVIAAKLDRLLAQVDSTKARLECIPAILKRFRQSVLAAAVSGRLTEEWREKNPKKSLIPDKENEKFRADLFDTVLQTLPELPEEWGVIPAANVLAYVTSGSRGWAKYYSNEGALFLRMSNVRYDTTRLDLEDLQYVKLPKNIEGKRSLVCKDDLIISITADVGRVARINSELCEAYVNQHLALVRPTKEVNSEYLAYCIASTNIGIKQVAALKRGATKAGLGLDDIRSLAIPFPPIEEQTEIVRRVEELFAFADSIEEKALAALERVGNLTQSILAKAFRGDLTAAWRAANPELISGDNSAEALLAKIKEERELLKKQPKPKRTGVKKKTGKAMSKEVIKVVEALKQAGKPLNGQQLLAAAGYPSDSSTEQLEQFFLDLRDALALDKSIVKLKRDDDGQDWFAQAEATHK